MTILNFILRYFSRLYKAIFWKRIFRRSSRQVRRNTHIVANGRTFKSSIYIDRLARKLPTFRDGNGRIIIGAAEHRNMLTKAFAADHVNGIKKYVAEVRKEVININKLKKSKK